MPIELQVLEAGLMAFAIMQVWKEITSPLQGANHE